MKPKVHDRVQKTLPLDSIASQKNPVHILTSYFFIIHFNIIFPAM